MPEEEKHSLNYQHLVSQVNYKLCEYQKAMKSYLTILQENKDMESDDVSDVVVNYLAC
jgi:hypothetical protein